MFQNNFNGQNANRERCFGADSLVEYKQEHGELSSLERLVEALASKPIARQARHFIIEKVTMTESYFHGNLDGAEQNFSRSVISESADVDSLIVKDGIIVGVICNGKAVLSGKRIKTGVLTDEYASTRVTVTTYCELQFYGYEQ